MGAAVDGAPLLAQARRTATTATGLVAAYAYSAYILANAVLLGATQRAT
jgi:hypothetical protein